MTLDGRILLGQLIVKSACKTVGGSLRGGWVGLLGSNQLTSVYPRVNKWSESRSVVSNSLWPHGLYSPWNSPGQNTGMNSLSHLQGIFPSQELNPGLLHCRQILYQLSHKGTPRILEWVSYPSSSRSSWPRNWTRVSCIAGGFFTNWAIMEAPSKSKLQDKFSIFSMPKKKKKIGVVSLLSSKMSCSLHNFYCAFILLTLEEIGTSFQVENEAQWFTIIPAYKWKNRDSRIVCLPKRIWLVSP